MGAHAAGLQAQSLAIVGSEIRQNFEPAAAAPAVMASPVPLPAPVAAPPVAAATAVATAPVQSAEAAAGGGAPVVAPATAPGPLVSCPPRDFQRQINGTMLHRMTAAGGSFNKVSICIWRRNSLCLGWQASEHMLHCSIFMHKL